jgi:uncharacterized protein (TIGR00299 family) protein
MALDTTQVLRRHKEMHTLYIDAFAGISGDMFLGAMLDMGLDKDRFLEELDKIPLQGYEIEVGKSERGHMAGTKVDVLCSVHHPHRGLGDILQILDRSQLSPWVKEKSAKAFRLLAEAEGKVHGKSPEEVHFHEVGAVDSIIDITGAFILVSMARPERIIFSPLNVGSGTVECAHGIMPVPAPATAEILKGIPVTSFGDPVERTTPTGALLAACLADSFGSMPSGRISECGVGLGTRKTDLPNLLRIFHIEEVDTASSSSGKDLDIEEGTVLETNIDDMNPQIYENVMKLLFSEGAMDVWLSGITMKKGRPATTLSCLCSPRDVVRMSEIILRNTSTLGIRTYPVRKMKLYHEIKEVETSLGRIRIKEGWLGEELVKTSLEYEDVKKVSEELKIPFIRVSEILKKEIEPRS